MVKAYGFLGVDVVPVLCGWLVLRKSYDVPVMCQAVLGFIPVLEGRHTSRISTESTQRKQGNVNTFAAFAFVCRFEEGFVGVLVIFQGLSVQEYRRCNIMCRVQGLEEEEEIGNAGEGAGGGGGDDM